MTLLILLFYLFHYGWAQGSLPLYPFAFPLAVRSPYLNCWGFPGFSDGFSIVAKTFASVASGDGSSNWDPSLEKVVLVVLVRVDNHTSMFLGDGTYDPAFLQVNLTNTVLSPTQTVLIAQAGPMQINLTFLNPIEHGNWVKQSIPLSYMSLTAKSLDNVAHSVQVYSEFSAVWVSGNQSQKINWNGIGRDNVIGHRINRQISTLSNRVPTDTDSGTLHHFMKMSNNITWKTDNSSVSRHSFLHGGVLDSTEDAYYGPSNQFTPDTVFAMSRDLGTIKATQDPVIWVIGYTTDPVINYADPSGTPQQRSSVYKIQYPDDLSLIIGFMNDFADASSRARQLDQKILQEAAPISGLLGDLVSYVTAQVYGSIQLTVATDSSGELNKSDVMAFNTGRPNTNRVNPVEMLYSAFPAFMYIDPDLGGLLLEPLFRLQVPPKYTNQYAAQDLGTSYPNVVVSNSPHNQGVEDSGNMLIMTCAHARASGDINLIKRHYDLLTSWANYLSNSTLFMGDQYSADGLSVDNQTNLAIKGIIAIKAMSQMSSFINNAADFDKYSNTSLRLYAQWKSLALAGDKHLLGTYGDMSSWTLGYNLFADLWLNTGIVESRVYDGQSSFIYNHTLSMPVDNINADFDDAFDPSHVTTTLSWNLFGAAMVPNQNLSMNLISGVYHQLFSSNTDISPPITIAGITLGAAYAPLILKVPAKLTVNPTTTVTPSKPHTSTIRGILGGVAALLMIVAIALVVRRRWRQSHRRTSFESSSLGEVVSQGAQVTVTPFNPTGSTLTEVAPLDVGPQTDSQQQLVHRPSQLEDSSVPLRGVGSVPVGLSGKELARLRSLANRSRSRPTDGQPSNPGPPLTTTADRSVLEGAAAVATSSSEARILRSEVVLGQEVMHEIQRFHTEISGPPPSYTSGAA